MTSMNAAIMTEFFIFSRFGTPLKLEPQKISENIESPKISCFRVLEVALRGKSNFINHRIKKIKLKFLKIC